MRAAAAILCCLLTVSSGLRAQTPDSEIPPQLRDWRAWVLHDLDYRTCPFAAMRTPNAASDYVCAWPGTLHLDAGATGASFSIAWRVQAPSWISLPGDAQYWPQQVTVNGVAQPILDHDATPALRLAPGSYAIKGRIDWHERPQTLAVPQTVGLIALSVDGKPVVQLERNGDELTLGRATSTAPQADHIDVRVFRKLDDSVPARLTTQIQLRVAGQAREEVLGPVLPEGFAPLSLQGDWPARLDSEGRLHVQVQPGEVDVTLQARATAPLTRATARLAPAPWPKQEIWSYAADAHLRVSAASGAVQVDPRQSDVPEQWQNLPAFALGNGDKLQIEQRSRGSAPDAPNRLRLQREAWLDFAGSGWYARDNVTGTMVRGWRLDAAVPYTLEQARAKNAKQGAGEDLLVTRAENSGWSGVEWRTPNVDLSGNLRIAVASVMPVAGWQQTFDSVQARLHLPYGYKLLAAPGADSASGSWMSAWTLLDVFVCAILVLLAWRVLGLAGAAAALAYLALGYQEADAPRWSLIAVFALALIAKTLPKGKLTQVVVRVRACALLVLVVVAVPFVATQVRASIYPQLEAGTGYVAASPQAKGESAYMPKIVERRKDMAVAAMQAAPRPMAPPAPAPASAALESVVVSGSNVQRADLIEHYSRTTIVQTGNGMPDWTLGSQAVLNWTGPVLATQSVRLVIVPPWLVRSLRIVLVALLAFLVLRLFRSSAPGLRWPRRAALGAGLLAFGALAISPCTQAQDYPTDALLQQLRARLLQAPKCAPACASMAQAQVTADGNAIGVLLEAHAGAAIALPLPNAGDSAMLKSVQVDGVDTDTIARGSDGSAWLALARGVHRIQLGYVAVGDKTTLAFSLKPARVLFQGRGWNATGIADDRLLADSLTLARERSETGGAAKPVLGVQQFPPYVQVTRNLTLGLEWSASTGVLRLAPASGGFSVRVALIKGEHVASAGFKDVDGQIEVAIADGADSAHWDSTLDKATPLTLTAPALTDRAEVWRITVGPTWHVDFSGVPSTELGANEDADDYRVFEFHPLPGETLTLTANRPQSLRGAQRAIDAVHLASEAGQHAATHTLALALRASQGGDQVLTLPADAQLLGVTRDNEALNLRARDGKLSLPVTPGVHRFEVRLRTDSALGMLTRTPSFALGLPAANVNLALSLPANRWLLAAWGPPVGPAVLYWGELIVMMLIAYALSRSGRTRLKFHDWLLLGLGFSTFSWSALIVVVVWLFVFDWRGRSAKLRNEALFNLSQIGLVLLTLLAVASLVSAVPQGLLGAPDMHVAGNGSSAQTLQWFADRSVDALPQGVALSVPLWVYKTLMLLWALWLANALIGWLRDALAAWTRDGYWRNTPKPVAVAEPSEVALKSDTP